MAKTNEEYILTQMYELEEEIKELNFIQPRLLEIVDFYFNKYGFGTKISRPDRYVFFDDYYSQLLKQLSELKFKLKYLHSKFDKFTGKPIKEVWHSSH